MIALLLQAARKPRAVTLMSVLRHWGAFGLFSLAILDGLPFPTFGGPDILTAILAARHRDPWYEYAAATTAGAVIGAYITFHLGRRAGMAYLNSKFGGARTASLLKVFQRWGTGALAVSCAVPFPFPTSVFFAAAGASEYDTRKFLGVVALSRAARYSMLSFLASRYGGHFIRALRNPTQHWGWLLLFAAVIGALAATGIMITRKLEVPAGAG